MAERLWINSLRFALLEQGIPHWPVSSLAASIMGASGPPPDRQGILYSCKLTTEPGSIRMTPDTSPKVFTDLDLYLMGLLPPEEVGEHIVFTNQADPAIQQCNGQLYTGAVQRVRVSDVIAAHGPRAPAAAAALRSPWMASPPIPCASVSADAASAYAVNETGRAKCWPRGRPRSARRPLRRVPPMHAEPAH